VHEDVVDPFHYAVTIYPEVLAVDVVPIPIDPNPARADRNLLPGNDHLGWRWSLPRGSDGLGLLDDYHRLAVDLLRRAFLGFDDHVARRSFRFGSLSLSKVTVVRHVHVVRDPRVLVAIRSLVIVSRRRDRKSRHHRHCKQSHASSK
jgi:hypothetical protein